MPITMPPPDEWLPDDSGIVRWSPVFDAVAIDDGPDGRKHMRISKEGVEIFALTLSKAAADALARRLTAGSPA